MLRGAFCEQMDAYPLQSGQEGLALGNLKVHDCHLLHLRCCFGAELAPTRRSFPRLWNAYSPFLSF